MRCKAKLAWFRDADSLDAGKGNAMMRGILTIVACLLLSACSGWVSDERIFGTGDWAHLDLNGPYDHQTAVDDQSRRVILRTRPDGMIESTGPGADDRGLMGLVPIKGGSGEYFLMIDRSDSSEKGDEYFIARVADSNAIALYLPDCRGTSPVAGMEKVQEQWPEEPALEVPAPEDGTAQAAEDAAAPVIGDDDVSADEAVSGPVCKFTTRDALMAAGLEAERFLATPHVVAVFPLATLEPASETPE